MKSFPILIAFLFAITIAHGQSSNTLNTLDIWVAGCCPECSERIEKTLDIRGVKTAEYDLSTHMLHVVFQPAKITEERIHELLNAAGHDTGNSICNESEYGLMDPCCRYREKGIVKKRVP